VPSRPAEAIAARMTEAPTKPNQVKDANAAAADKAKTRVTASSGGPQELVAALPTTCDAGKECIPPRDFAAAACRGHYPSMAIAMFEKHTPWQRLYVKVESLDAVNAYGDRSGGTDLVFGEEVLVLRGLSQPRAGKLQISSSDIDVLRWDGTCVTVDRGNFSTTRMANLEQAAIRWRHLEDSFQQALLTSTQVAVAHERHRAVCRGSRDAAAAPQCQKAASKLSEAIGAAVRAGLSLPTPAKLPTWATPEQAEAHNAVAMTSDVSERLGSRND
jgi:hypothetical protein